MVRITRETGQTAHSQLVGNHQTLNGIPLPQRKSNNRLQGAQHNKKRSEIKNQGRRNETDQNDGKPEKKEHKREREGLESKRGGKSQGKLGARTKPVTEFATAVLSTANPIGAGSLTAASIVHV